MAREFTKFLTFASILVSISQSYAQQLPEDLGVTSPYRACSNLARENASPKASVGNLLYVPCKMGVDEFPSTALEFLRKDIHAVSVWIRTRDLAIMTGTKILNALKNDDLALQEISKCLETVKTWEQPSPRCEQNLDLFRKEILPHGREARILRALAFSGKTGVSPELTLPWGWPELVKPQNLSPAEIREAQSRFDRAAKAKEGLEQARHEAESRLVSTWNDYPILQLMDSSDPSPVDMKKKLQIVIQNNKKMQVRIALLLDIAKTSGEKGMESRSVGAHRLDMSPLEAVFELTSFPSVMEEVLAEEPDLCPVAIKLFYHKSNLELADLVLELAGTTAAFRFLPPMASVPLSIGMAGYWIYQSNQDLQATLTKSLSQRNDQVSVSDVLQSAENLKIQWMTAPFAIVGFPVFKSLKWARQLRGTDHL